MTCDTAGKTYTLPDGETITVGGDDGDVSSSDDSEGEGSVSAGGGVRWGPSSAESVTKIRPV